jgi:two-component system sensor kinase FixL
MFGIERFVASILEDRYAIWAIALGMMLGIAGADWAVSGVSLGMAYVIPIILASLILPRISILALSLAAALLREQLGPSSWNEDAPFRLLLSLVVFLLAGFFTSELVRNRRLVLELVAHMKAAEEETRQLVEGCPGAILTVGADGRILQSNRAAQQLLGFDEDSPLGQDATQYLPMLATLLRSIQEVSLVRTMVEGSARRRSGESFFAQMWLSTYHTPAGPRIAVIFSDATEILRDREELGLRQLMMSSSVATAAISHEVRNLSVSARRLWKKLSLNSALTANPDFLALGTLLDGMHKITAQELAPAVEEFKAGADLNAVLQVLLLIIEPQLRELQAGIDWEVDPNLPRVRGDQSGLLQVLLNLAQNGIRALQETAFPRFSLVAYPMGQAVILRFGNNGKPIESTDRLFEPLHSSATSSGLGLFISRAILRTYGGELQYVPEDKGCMFLIQLPIAARVREPSHV